MKEKIKSEYLYMILVGILSLVSLTFLPMVGSTVGLEWQIPNTTPGWIVFIVTKLIIAGLNMLIFHCFVKQGRINIREDENFKNAFKKWHKMEDKKKHYISPKEYYGRTYGRKGTSVFLISLLSTFALTQALLQYDLTTFLTYLFTIGMGIAFGILQMKATEEYWTIDFVDYINYKESIENGTDSLQNTITTNTEE